jgi:hypothetical protein
VLVEIIGWHCSNKGHKNGGGEGLALTLEDAAMVPRSDRIAEEGPVQHVADAEPLRRECRDGGGFLGREVCQRPRMSVVICLATTRDWGSCTQAAKEILPLADRKYSPTGQSMTEAADICDATR